MLVNELDLIVSDGGSVTEFDSLDMLGRVKIEFIVMKMHVFNGVYLILHESPLYANQQVTPIGIKVKQKLIKF